MKGNTKVKVKTKWIRKLRRNSTRPPLHDEEQAQKRQRTSSPLLKPEDAFKEVEEVLLDSEETKETSLPPNGVANETGPFDFEASGVAMQGETTHEGDSSNQGESSNLREVEAIHHQEETTVMVVPSAAPASPAVSQVSMTSRQLMDHELEEKVWHGKVFSVLAVTLSMANTSLIPVLGVEMLRHGIIEFWMNEVPCLFFS